MTPKKLIMRVAMKAVVLNMGGCNTVKGAGQDIEKGGEAIQKAVK